MSASRRPDEKSPRPERIFRTRAPGPLEVDELRACLEYDDESATYKPYLDPLDGILRELHDSLTAGNYHGTGEGHDLAFMPLFIRHERDIPFREILRTLNATHREGFERAGDLSRE